jgi:flagellar basal body P-ring formation protein FlgA
MRLRAYIIVIVMLAPLLVQAQGRGGATRRLTPAQIQRLATTALAEVMPSGVELQEVQWNQQLSVPRGQLEAVAYLESDEPVRDRLRARIELFVNEESFRTIRVRLIVRDRRQVVVATRGLRPGDVIDESDVTLREPPAGVYIRQPLRELDDAVGNVLAQTVSSGGVLEESQVRPPAAVRRRERVRIIARSSGIEVIAQGEPLEDGAIGEVVRVVCLMSRRTLQARVLGEGVVEVR